jgi:hypothetical protein
MESKPRVRELYQIICFLILPDDVACFGPLASQDEDGLAPGPDCAICHVWVSEEFGKSLPEPSEEEEHNFNLMYEKHNYRYGR